jgi:hypothetical protein
VIVLLLLLLLLLLPPLLLTMAVVPMNLRIFLRHPAAPAAEKLLLATGVGKSADDGSIIDTLLLLLPSTGSSAWVM